MEGLPSPPQERGQLARAQEPLEPIAKASRPREELRRRVGRDQHASGVRLAHLDGVAQWFLGGRACRFRREATANSRDRVCSFEVDRLLPGGA
jgi:hypothetical protein